MDKDCKQMIRTQLHKQGLKQHINHELTLTQHT